MDDVPPRDHAGYRAPTRDHGPVGAWALAWAAARAEVSAESAGVPAPSRGGLAWALESVPEQASAMALESGSDSASDSVWAMEWAKASVSELEKVLALGSASRSS
jgi:hypothetical protein